MITAAVDGPARAQIRTDLDRSLFVEAAAGTGKTTAVLERIVAAVASGRVRMERLVAITFTVAAAGELRVRTREALEAAARELDDATSRERCATSAQEVERAHIETIHAFCAALLASTPLEAGLPPGFRTLDALDAERDLHERFRQWFDSLSADHEPAESVRRALLLELEPHRLRDAFTELSEHWELLERAPAWRAALPSGLCSEAAALAETVEAAIARLDECRDAEDRLRAHLETLRPLAGRLRRASRDDDVLTLLPEVAGSLSTSAGRRENWPGTACADIRAALKGAAAQAETLLCSARTAVSGAITAALRACTLRYADERRVRGVLTYQDLLVRARNLVRDYPSVRDRLRRTFDLIVIDEFQDTDPLQVELAFRLAAEPGAADEDWSLLPLRPGVLALVGDPKQSIYRFRGADIALYARVQRSLAGSPRAAHVALQRNFRSAARIVDAVNAVFGGSNGLMSVDGDDGTQAPYIELVAADPGVVGSVAAYGDAVDGPAGEMWRAEADSTGALITTMLSERRPVALGAPSGPRPCRPGDICILMPSRANLRNIERALVAAHLPYRLESSALLIATQEARDLRNMLRALDDPSDEIAVVASLRAPAFGCSDAELLQWRERHGSWSYLATPPVESGTVHDAMVALRRLHEMRAVMSPSALLETLIQRRLVRAAAAESRRPAEALRRLRYVSDQLAAAARAGGTTLHDAVEHLERIADSPRYDDVATGGDDEDCVHVMTVHAAKGLEFPIVVLTGFGRKPRDLPPALCWDRERGTAELKIASGFATSGWDDVATQESGMQLAERRRLMYVAMTRPRDHLCISLFRGTRGGRQTDADHLASRLATLRFVDVQPAPAPVPPALPQSTSAPAADVEQQRHDETAWVDRRTHRLKTLSSVPVASATSLAHLGDGEHPHDSLVDAIRRGRGATAVGRAVHAVLQLVNLQSLDDLCALARTQAAAEGIAGRAADVERLVRAAWSTPTVQEAVRSRHSRELPLGARIDGVLLEGFIDLLWQTSDGRCVVVDYKTDDVSAAEIDERMRGYRIQGAAYALLVQSVLHRTVCRIDFVFAARGETRSITDVGDAINEVRPLLASVA